MPRALRLLKKTARLCGSNTVVIEAAIGSEPGQAELNEMPHLDISFVHFGTGGGRPSIGVRTIDQLTEEYGMPDLLKIDVEGAELSALQGASTTLSQQNPPIVMIEYIESNATHFDSYGLTDLLCHFPEDRFKTFRIIKPGQLQQYDKSGPDLTNDYLMVPVQKLSVIEPLLVGLDASAYQTPL